MSYHSMPNRRALPRVAGSMYGGRGAIKKFYLLIGEVSRVRIGSTLLPTQTSQSDQMAWYPEWLLI